MRKLRLKPLMLSLGAIAGLFCLMVFIPSMALELVGLDHPTIPIVGAGLKIYDRYDRPVCTIYGERDQQLVRLDEVSSYVPQAFLAAEDHDFYWHAGVNPMAILRAVMVDVTHGHPIQGGSTISQQLVKNLYFEGKKRTVSDKITEAFMAMDIEKHYNKQQILEAYLNYVYFGRGVYGIQRASEQYFGKHPSKLTVAEAAYLAGLVTAPSDLSRPANRKQAVHRQQLTLNSMQELHYITDKQAAAAKKQTLAFKTYTNPALRYQQYTGQLIELVQKQLNTEDVYKDGYRVYTNMDAKAQEAAERMIASGIRSAPKGINQGALVSISVEDGGIVAMVGGVGAHNEWNRALSPHTAGSAFKPFVYLAALSKGAIAPDTLVDDAPLEIRQVGGPIYSPKNFDNDFLGTITIRKAIALSRNTCAVRVAQAVGPGEVVKFARAAGVTSKLDENLSLALGSSAVSPLDMANSYATLARSGMYLEPQMMRKITDKNGKIIKEFGQHQQKVFDDEPVAELVDALQDVVERGTGTHARLFDRPVAGKTGTSDAGKDLWFIGFTPDLVTAVWGGNDDNKPVSGRVSGGSVMAGIWHNYMSAYYQQHNVPAGTFPEPAHPLMEEQEPLQIWPAPSDAINRFFGGWFEVPQAPRRYSDSDDNDDDRDRDFQRISNHYNQKGKPKKKGFMRKLLGLFDF
jgi:penicillin-binding protein 1A